MKTNRPKKRSIFEPPWPQRQEEQYQKLLLVMLRQWRNGLTPVIRQVLSQRVYQDAGMDSLLEAIQTNWATIVVQFTPEIGQVVTSVDRRVSNWWLDFTSAATGFSVPAIQPMVTEPWLKAELEARTAINVRKVRGIGEKAATDIEELIRNGVRDGRSTSAIAADVKTAFDTTERRAMLIARNEIGNLVSNQAQLRQQDAGGEEYYWSTSGDIVVRPEHKARDGQVFSWKNPPKGGHPGEAINCRCVARIKVPDSLYNLPVLPKYRNKMQRVQRAKRP